MLLAHGNIDYEDEAIWGAEFHQRKLSGAFPWGKTPVIELPVPTTAAGVEDHRVVTVAQSGAIARWSARLAGCYPEDPARAAVADSVYELGQELCTINPLVNCYVGQDFDRIENYYFGEVLPQALHFMGIDSSHAEAPGWATIVVYSCEASCAPPPLPLADGTGTLADVAEGVAGDAARCAAIGLRVRLMDLNRRAELNGQSGLVVGWSAAAERWEVCLESGEKLRVRSVNLRPVDGSAASRSRGWPTPGASTTRC